MNESFCVIKLLFKPTETSTTRNHHERGGLNGKLLKTSYFASADTIFNCEQSPIRQRLDFSKPPGSSSPGNIFGRLRFQRPRGPQPFQRPQRPQRLQRLQRLQCLQRTEHSQGKSYNLNQGKLTLLLHGASLKSHKFLYDLKLPELLVPNPTNPLRPLLVASRKLSECLTPNPADPLRPYQDLKLTELTKSPVVEAYRKLSVFVPNPTKLTRLAKPAVAEAYRKLSVSVLNPTKLTRLTKPTVAKAYRKLPESVPNPSNPLRPRQDLKPAKFLSTRSTPEPPGPPKLVKCVLATKTTAIKTRSPRWTSYKAELSKCNQVRCRIKLGQNPVHLLRLDKLMNNFLIQIDERQACALSKDRLRRSGNVELNPGPASTQGGNRNRHGDLMVTTYNIRGLKDESKMRHFLNLCYKNASKSDQVVLLQETYIDQPGKLPFIWRGNFFLTAGEGHSGGCLTLLSSHLNVVASREIAKRAHVLACQKQGEAGIAYIIANIYAPNPNTTEKIEFYEKLFELVHELELLYDCSRVIVAGDFNLTFKEAECKNRNRSVQEKRVANHVASLARDSGLVDIWSKDAQPTWRRPNTDCFSCLDHIFYSNNFLNNLHSKTDWSLSFSDHAAVVTCLNLCNSVPSEKSRIVRLDPSLIKTPVDKAELAKHFDEIWRHSDPTWDPHTKLEYAKLCIRTVAERLQAERKRREVTEEEEVNEELELSISKLEKGCKNLRERATLIDYVEELRARKEALIEVKGKRLAEKLGSKWYNEGEKSTKYFLRLLQRHTPDKFGELVNSRNETLASNEEIENEIVNFYKTLYENYDSSHLVVDSDQTFFNEVQSVSGPNAAEIVKPITLEDLTKTLLTCRDSSPGPDGIPYSFLGALWSTMGPLICEAWNHSLRTGKLCPSHKTSYLRLIPKAGKDIKKLTNWRPITLSNCDHKLITKTYSIRISSKVEEVIKARQTAYLKGRLINDNIRSIAMTLHLSNLREETIDGLLVSLDAKKAFDSVEHSYIEKCLERFGLAEFVRIFRILYAGLKTDILINGKIVPGYLIKRGVKQGDALSCVLFIMCMEPMIANIEANPNISSIRSRKLDSELPKAYTYADDLNCVIRNTRKGLQSIFDEYSRLTRQSGLELNADKTEILRFANQLKSTPFNPEVFRIKYLGKTFDLSSVKETKINGIFFQQNEEAMRTRNVESVRQKMENQLKNWSKRNLTTLGKILIVKTFGISQVIFLMQSIVLNKLDFKMLNEILYRFIWNKHFHAAKAPERVKREILTTSFKNGGYGMLDIAELDDGLKLRSLGRLLTTKHPTLTLMKNKINFDDFFFPKFDAELDSYVARGVELLKHDRTKLLSDPNLRSDIKLVKAVRACKVLNVIKPQFKNNITVFMLGRAGKREIGQLNPRELGQLKNLLNSSFPYDLLSASLALRLPHMDDETRKLYVSRGKWVELSKLTSKEIRLCRSLELPICSFKSGLLLDPGECQGWLKTLNSLNSTGHKNAILRFVHGDIYSKERQFRFGLSDTPNCETCGQIETINHRIIECDYADTLWRVVANLTELQTPIDQSFVVGAYVGCSKGNLTLHAEIITRLIRNTRVTHLNPETYVKNLVTNLAKREKGETKTELEGFI